MTRSAGFINLLALSLFLASSAEAQSGNARQQPVELRAAAPAWIGISFGSGPPPSRDVIVEGLIAGAPAQRAGVLIGDRVLQWNGRSDVDQAIRQTTLQPGDTVRLRIGRPGARDRDVVVIAEPRSPMIRLPIGDGDSILLRFDGPFLQDFAAVSARQRELAQQLDSLRTVRFRMLEPGPGQAPRASFTPPFFSFGDSMRVSISPESFRFGAAPRISPNAQSYTPGFAITVTGGRTAVAGAELTDLGAGLASYFGTGTGVLVLRIAPNTPAARGGLQEGDVIVSAGGTAVRTVADLRQALSAAGARALPVEVIRHRERRTVTLGG